MSIDCLTMDTPEGMTTSEAGSYYTMATDGTPTTRRHIFYAPAAIAEAETAENQQAPVRPDSIQIPNPEFIPDYRWKQLRKWVHCWFAARIPEQHRHLINDVIDGDIEDLLKKVYGMAARDPATYCKMLKTKMTKLPLDFDSFNVLGHQWVLDQFEIYGTTQDASCDGTHKMPECDFVDIVVDKPELLMPKFIDIYRRHELIGQAWSSELLLRHITNIAAKGNFKIEKEAREEHSVATSRLRLHQQEQRDYEREKNWYSYKDNSDNDYRWDRGDMDWERENEQADHAADDTCCPAGSAF